MAHGELLWRAIVSSNLKLVAIVVVGVVLASFAMNYLSGASSGSSSSTGGQ
jgi:hypothetical protein